MRSPLANESQIQGFLFVDKPVGLTSFDVVKKVRWLTKTKQVGHAGTLDPFASGLLILALGRQFTKQIYKFQDAAKTYAVKMVLGIQTDTLDAYGKIEKYDQVKTNQLSYESIDSTLHQFVGEQAQIPPMFSAKKVNGQRLYHLARQGIQIEIEPKNVVIHDVCLDQVDFYQFPIIQFTTRCSKGTYVRSLVRDIGEKMHSVAYTKDLVRTHIDHYDVKDAIAFSDLTRELIVEKISRVSP
ncbi:MAG: tRNA pseudouridine55 synthase [Candidatus Marinamargulisbacteria bacterium]|jgi:tRNA pseudouridine55 synthase